MLEAWLISTCLGPRPAMTYRVFLAQFSLQLLFMHSCLIATGCSTCTSNSSYYVVVANGTSCPNSSSTCQELSYYTSQPSVFFTNNTVFYFLEGHHILDQQVVISGVNNLTLQGLGTIETGHHETVTQSTVVIKCNRSTGGFVFMDGDCITINAISLTDCTDNLYLKGFDIFLEIGVLPAGFVNASLAFQQVKNFHLKNVSIQNANGYGLLSINSFNVSMEDCSFDHNQNNVSSDSEHRFNDFTSLFLRGGNALVLYAYFTEYSLALTTCTLDILHTNFTFSQGRQYGSGIGLLIYFNHMMDNVVDILIDNVVAYGNTGSGNLLIGGFRSNTTTVTINNTLLLYGITLPVDIKNPGLVGVVAGGLSFEIITLLESNLEFNTKILVYNSNITHNQAGNVGGISITCYNFHVEFHNCLFYKNTGNVASALYVIDILGSSATPDFGVEQVALFNVTFDDNRSSVKNDEDHQSAVTFEKVSAIGFHDVKVSNNPTTGLVALSSNVVFYGGHNIFLSNSGVDGGGMALYGYSNLFLIETVVNFTANDASRFGGGLYVNQEKSIVSDCFFLSIFSNNNKLLMSQNTADLAGFAVYGGKIEKCFNTNFSSVFEILDQNGSSVVSSDPQKICLCTNDLQKVNCNTLEYNYPYLVPAGGEFSIPVSAVGNMNGTTPAVIAINDISTNSIKTINTSGKCENLSFVLKTTNSSQAKVKVTVGLVGSSFTSHLSLPQKITAIVSVLPCPPGFELSNSSGVCECSSMLKSIFSCNISTQEFSRSRNVWLGYSNNTNCTLLSNNCPLDYCRQGSLTFLITNPDLQCALNRSGVLCGGCADNMSLLLGSNKCHGECSWWHVLLLLVFAVVGIVLVALLIALNLTVSVGAINGLIFYANMVKILEDYLFPQGSIPAILSQFISWINLDFGIEVCFVPGLTGYIKAWLQFVFPGYIFLILLLIVIFAHFSKRLLNLIGTQVVPVLATLFLLSYTKLIRSVIQALYVTHVSCDGQPHVSCVGHLQAVWFVDGNIRYLSDSHLPLFIFALLLLIFLITPYTLFLLTSPFIEAHLTGYRCFRWIFRLKPVLDAYGGPYNDRFRVWTGFLLLIRVILALITSLSDDPSVSIGALMCTMVILITIHCIAHEVYSKWYLNALEIVFLLNLMLLGYFAEGQLTMHNNELARHGNSIASVVLLSISFLMFLGIVLYHILLRLKSRVDIEVLIKNNAKVFVSKIWVKKKELQADYDDIYPVHVRAQNMIHHPNNAYRELLLANSDVEPS